MSWKRGESSNLLLKYSVLKFLMSPCSLLAILATILEIKLKFLNAFFSAPNGQKFQFPSERALPEVLKTHLTFNTSALFVGVMASQTWEPFFWDTL